MEDQPAPRPGRAITARVELGPPRGDDERCARVTRGVILYGESATKEDTMPSDHDKLDSQKVIRSLNTILELELAGVVRYLHYSLMVFGHARIPIISWMRNQATEGMNHAAMAGEY